MNKKRVGYIKDDRYQTKAPPEDPNKAICPLPFYQLFLNPNGKIAPCCYLSQEEPVAYHVGDFNENTLEEIWNSEKMQILRREFLNGNPKICKKYIDVNRCNLIRRDLLEHVDLKENPTFPMKKLDLMLNGKCNLECSMCHVWTMPNNVYTENGFWEEGPTKIFPYLREIDAKGGEPFVQKDIFRLIDEVSEVNPKCFWHFTTNGHYKFSQKMHEAINKIHIVRLSLSIDSLDPKVFAKIRKKGDLALTLESLDGWLMHFKITRSGRGHMNINTVVQRDNWREVPAFIELCKKKRIAPFFIPLTRPEEHSIFTLSERERLEIVDYYCKMMVQQKERVYIRLITSILNSLSQANDISERCNGLFAEAKSYNRSIAEIDY